MRTSLAHRANVPFMVIVPDDPDALRLIRLLLMVFNFLWRNRAEILLLIENINMVFDAIESALEMCGVCYDYFEFALCKVKSELSLPILNCI